MMNQSDENQGDQLNRNELCQVLKALKKLKTNLFLILSVQLSSVKIGLKQISSKSTKCGIKSYQSTVYITFLCNVLNIKNKTRFSIFWFFCKVNLATKIKQIFRFLCSFLLSKSNRRFQHQTAIFNLNKQNLEVSLKINIERLRANYK